MSSELEDRSQPDNPDVSDLDEFETERLVNFQGLELHSDVRNDQMYAITFFGDTLIWITPEQLQTLADEVTE